MEKSCKVKHYFPGGNTTQGFFSYYDHILTQEEATRIICLKGGPGVGKSTYMKRIGKAMEEKGFEVEYMHCSSDPNSLDGVVIPQIKLALIDGTAPHVVDPKNPGAVDENIHPLGILNMNIAWNAVIVGTWSMWLFIGLRYFFVSRWDKYYLYI